ncbi:hypothetical protein Ciccas_014227, partial [Cichlidogyrus casuarinus]
EKDEHDNGWTVLHTAAFHGFHRIVRVLLHYEADMASLDETEWTPFYYAVAEGHFDAVRIFVEHAKQEIKESLLAGLIGTPYTPMQLAIINGHYEIVEYLLNNRVKLTQVTETGDTCLHLACKSNDVKLFNLIFRKDTDALDKRNRSGQSPLHYAATHDCDSVADELIKKRANLELQDYKKRTPLFIAVQFSSAKTLELLLSKGASVHTVDRLLKTCVSRAVEKSSFEVFQILLNHILDNFQHLLNQGDDNRYTPLHTAAENGKIEMVKVLLGSEGINTVARDYKKRTALHLAARRGHLE